MPTIACKLPEFKFVVVATRISENLGVLPSNIQLWGKAKTQDELARLYSEADVAILLSKRETFSMVTAESLCCGTPVVGFKAGGPESIAIKEYCVFVEYGDINHIISSINSVDTIDHQSVAHNGSVFFSKEKMAIQYLKAFQLL